MPTVQFKLFSNDATGSPPDPDTASTVITLPMPKDMIRNGTGDSIITPPEGRGSVHQTLNSVVVQDYGVPSNLAGGTIFLEDDDELSESQKTALESAYEEVDTEWYFTDSLEVYKVQFSRSPVGFHAWLNYVIYSASGIKKYSYQLQFIIIEKVS